MLCSCLSVQFLQLLLLRVQFPDRADVLALMRRHPSWPNSGSGTPAAAAAEQDGESDTDGAAGLSDDAQDDMQDEVPAAAARLPRGAKSRNYNAQERAVMREYKLSHLANVTCRTLTTGAMRWGVKLNAEGLQRTTRKLTGES
jgi:hypothetical protein